MSRIDLLKLAEQGNHSDLHKLLSTLKPDSKILTQAIFRCMEIKPFTSNHLSTISTLIQYGADLSFSNQRNQTCLMLACLKNFTHLVRIFLNNRANAKDKDRQDTNCISIALQNEENDPIEILQELEKRGVGVNERDLVGAAPLHYAAKRGYFSSVLFLLSRGADANLIDANLDTPLHLAFRFDKERVVRVLWRVTDLRRRNVMGKCPVEEACGRCKEFSGDWGDVVEVDEEGIVEEEKKEAKNEVRYEKKEERKEKKQEVEREKEEISDQRSVCLCCNTPKPVYCMDCINQSFLEKYQMLYSTISTLTSQIELLQSENTSFQYKISSLQSENTSLQSEISTLQSKNESLTNLLSQSQPLSPIFLTYPPTPDPSKLLFDFSSSLSSFQSQHSIFLQSSGQTYIKIFKILKGIIEEKIPKSKLELFGSVSTDLFLPRSDIDLVFIPDQACEPIVALEKVLSHISLLPLITSTEKVFNANFPILRIFTTVNTQVLKIDMSVKVIKHKGIQCSHLVKHFLFRYPEVRNVFLVLKQLIYCCEFNEPFKGGISSYGLFLMLIYYYQESLKIQKLQKEENSSKIFFGFLEFYINFEYKEYIAVDYEWWDNKDYKYRNVNYR